jgi:hypothetical protein
MRLSILELDVMVVTNQSMVLDLSAEIALISIFVEIVRHLLLTNMILIMFSLNSRDLFLLQYHQLRLYFRSFIRVQMSKSADQKNADESHFQKKWNLLQITV